MADYWRYADARPQMPAAAGAPAPMAVPQAASQAAAAAGGQPLKRARPADLSDVSGAPEMAGYYPRDEERAGYRAARDTETLNASYERFLRTGQIQSYASGSAGESIRPAVGGNAGYPIDDRPVMAMGGMDGRNIGFAGGMPEPPLPPDASNTLFIEGIPTDCARREVSHIFRPFVGFREVRLVNKEPRHPGGDPILLCFVDFANAAQAAIAMEALQAMDHGVFCGVPYSHLAETRYAALALKVSFKRMAINLMNMIAVHLICGCSLLVLRVRGGLQDQVVLVISAEYLSFCYQARSYQLPKRDYVSLLVAPDIFPHSCRIGSLYLLLLSNFGTLVIGIAGGSS